MPVVVRLRYCVIRMYFKDHNPPHFHVDTTEGSAEYTIKSLELMAGQISSRAEKEALSWATENRFKLWRLWKEYNP